MLTDATEVTYALVFETGDEVMSLLEQFSRDQGIEAAHFSAIGAFQRSVVGFFDWDQKDYVRHEVPEQVEVLVLSGHVTRYEGAPQIHTHVVLGRPDLSAIGGHLVEAHVRPTLEVVLTETPAYLKRSVDRESGLPLIDLGRGG